MRPTLFIPITKVDFEKREVWGVVAEERTDKTGREKFNYAKSKPHFEQWSGDFLARTTASGVEPSYGNVRYMHQPEPVGKLIGIEFRDAACEVAAGARVTSERAWSEVTQGVLTGFSIGGDYDEIWDDPVEKGVKCYSARPVEISLVDNPCMYGTTYQMVRADGVTELVKFVGGALQAAVVSVRDRGATALETLRAAGHGDGARLAKGLWTVGRLAAIVQDLDYLVGETKYERDAEGDGSPVPDRLTDALLTLGELLVAMAEEEIGELATAHGATTDAVPLALVAKAGARNAKQDQARIQRVHDASVELGAACAPAEKVAHPTEDDMTSEELQKAIGAAVGGLKTDLEKSLGDAIGAVVTKAVGEATAPLAKVVEETKASVDGLEKSVGAIDARLQVVEASGAAPKGVTRVVAATKEVETGGSPPIDLEKATPLELVKLAHQHPMIIHRDAAA